MRVFCVVAAFAAVAAGQAVLSDPAWQLSGVWHVVPSLGCGTGESDAASQNAIALTSQASANWTFAGVRQITISGPPVAVPGSALASLYHGDSLVDGQLRTPSPLADGYCVFIIFTHLNADWTYKVSISMAGLPNSPNSEFAIAAAQKQDDVPYTPPSDPPPAVPPSSASSTQITTSILSTASFTSTTVSSETLSSTRFQEVPPFQSASSSRVVNAALIAIGTVLGGLGVFSLLAFYIWRMRRSLRQAHQRLMMLDYEPVDFGPSPPASPPVESALMNVQTPPQSPHTHKGERLYASPPSSPSPEDTFDPYALLLVPSSTSAAAPVPGTTSAPQPEMLERDRNHGPARGGASILRFATVSSVARALTRDPPPEYKSQLGHPTLRISSAQTRHPSDTPPVPPVPGAL